MGRDKTAPAGGKGKNAQGPPKCVCAKGCEHRPESVNERGASASSVL